MRKFIVLVLIASLLLMCAEKPESEYQSEQSEKSNLGQLNQSEQMNEQSEEQSFKSAEEGASENPSPKGNVSGNEISEKLIELSSQPEGYFDELKEIIESDADSAAKEDAIIGMAELSIAFNDTERVISYLKEIAYNEENDTVRTAAYAAIDLIRDYKPIILGDMVVDVEGELKPGVKSVIVVKVTAFSDVTGTVSFARLPKDFEVSNPYYKLDLDAGEEKEFRFEFTPKQSGEYAVTIVSHLSTDRVDYYELRQKLLLKIEEDGGEVVYMSE
ncbi:MAG: hypothetical protein H0Z28_08115 [Archaeoglobus sp.]|nr:hypothetical protein [Archaeoglobus sp.]